MRQLCGGTYLFGPLLDPARYPSFPRRPMQLDLFYPVPLRPTQGWYLYQPRWVAENRRVTNRDARVRVPATAIQMSEAFEHIRRIHAPIVADLIIEGMQLIIQDIPLLEIPSHLRSHRVIVRFREWRKHRKKGRTLRGAWREVRIGSKVRYHVPAVAEGYCKQFLNGF